jgi:hypothetical protein
MRHLPAIHTAIRYLRARPGLHLLFSLQLLFVSLLLSMCLSSWIAAKATLAIASAFASSDPLYALVDITPEEQLIGTRFAEDDIVDALTSLLDELRSSSVFRIMMVRHDASVPYSIGGQHVQGQVDAFSTRLPVTIVDTEYLHSFPIRLDAGQSLLDTVTSGDVIPVVVGYQRSTEMPIGTVFTLPTSANATQLHEVVGVMAPGSITLNSPRQFGTVNLDDGIVILASESVVAARRQQIGSLDMWLTNALIATEEPAAALYQIRQACRSRRLYTFALVDYEDALDRRFGDARRSVMIIASLALSVLLFSLTSIVAVKLAEIQSRGREYGIHLLCGASAHDIVLIVSWEIAIVYLCALVPFAVTSTLVRVPVESAGISVATSGLFLALAARWPIRRLRKRPIAWVLRRKE